MIVDGINNNYPPYGELHVYNQDGHVRLLADYAKTVFLAENGNETIAMRDTLIARYSADGNRLSSINFIPPSPEYRMQEWVIGKDGSPFRLYEILPSSPEGICSYSVEKYDATNGKKIWSFERDVARSCSHSEVEVINDDEIMMMRRAQGDYLSAYTSGQEVYFGHHHAYKATQSGVLVSEYGSGSSSSISKLDWAGKSLWSKPITRHFDEALYFLGNEELVVNEADIVLSLSILLNRPDHWDGPVLVERYE